MTPTPDRQELAFVRFSMTFAMSVQTWSRSPVSSEKVIMGLPSFAGLEGLSILVRFAMCACTKDAGNYAKSHFLARSPSSEDGLSQFWSFRNSDPATSHRDDCRFFKIGLVPC